MIIEVRPQSTVFKNKTKAKITLHNLKPPTLVAMGVIWFPWITQSFPHCRFTGSVWHTDSSYSHNSPSVIERGKSLIRERFIMPFLQDKEMCILFYYIYPAWTLSLPQYSCCLLTSTQFWPLPTIPGILNTLSISCLLTVTM